MDEAEGREVEELGASQDNNYRQLYAAHCKSLSYDTRLNLAQTSQGNVLLALCFDPSAVIIGAIVRNPNSSVVHARLIARHHQTTTGLMSLGQKPVFLSDEVVKTALLRNPLAGTPVLAKFLASYNLFKLAEIVSGHESTQVGVRQAKQKLRDKVQKDIPEDVAYFIIHSEGRSLADLGGDTLPQEVINRLCKERYTSETLVYNLASFPALPPRLISHLLSQQIVRHNKLLRRRLTTHRNCPAALKGSG